MPTELIFTQPSLSRVLTRAAALPVKGTLEALAMGHLSLVDGVPWLRTTDLEQTITERCTLTEGSAPDDPGPWLLPLARASALVRTLPADGLVRLRLDGLQMVLRCGKARATWQLLEPEMYPAPAAMPEDSPGVPVAGSVLATLLERVQYAVSDDSTRYSLQGVHVSLDAGMLTLTATNGHRLARASAPVESAETWQGIIGANALSHLLRLCRDTDGDVHLCWNDQAVQASTESLTLHTRLIDARYPDCEGVIPREAVLGTVERLPWIEAVRTLLSLSTDKVHRVVCTPGEETLVLTVAAEGSDGEVEIPAAWTEAPPAPWALSGRYLVEMLATLPGTQVALTMHSPLAPMLATCPEDTQCLALLMPQRIVEGH